jgi:hypothetical protein
LTPAEEYIANFSTLGGDRARVIFIAAAGLNARGPFTINTSSGSPHGDMMLYLAVPGSTQVVGHDGHQVVNYAKVTIVENRRLRRRYQLN